MPPDPAVDQNALERATAETRLCDLRPEDFRHYTIRSRDEQFRGFEPERIAGALAKALMAAQGVAEPTPAIRTATDAMTKEICAQLVERLPDGGSFYIEEVQDQCELALMRAGEHDAARRFVLYREQRRRERDHNPLSLPDPEAAVEALREKVHDPMLEESMDRFVMFPIKYDELWDAYKDHLALVWTAEEIDLSKDIQDWKKLGEGEQHFLKHVLAFFAASDGIVNENLAVRFYHDLKIPEARSFYTMQMLIESIHSETYSLLIDTYIQDHDEKDRLLHAAETMPIVKRKAEWALRWLDSDASLAHRLIAFACVEGVFFSSSFCSIYWIKDAKQGMLPGLAFSNELISRDEGLHTDFAVLLHRRLKDKCPVEDIHAIFREAVDIEMEFASESLPVSLIGMNCEAMQKYIQFVADRLLIQLGVPKLYHVACPFDFMERISLQNKTNFHERKVAEYRKASVGSSAEDQTLVFDDEDF